MDLHMAFLEDIIASPEDDAPRLIYADWLEENGDEARAEFIRLQVARAKAEGGLEVPERGREAELLAAHRARWTAGLSGRAHRALFRRGFVEGVQVDPGQTEAFRKGLTNLCRSFPLRLLRLESPDNACLKDVVERIAKGRLHAEQLDIDLEEAATPGPWFERLLELPPAAKLRSLLIEHENATPEWDRLIARLDEPGPLRNLTELGIGFGTTDEPISPEVIERLTASPVLGSLTKLHIPFSRFGTEGMRTLATSPLRAKLTHLDVGCCHVPYEGWRLLVEGPNVGRLKWLGLIGAHVLREQGWESLRDHEFGRRLVQMLGDRADYVTSSTFPRWKGVTVE
jgi:uncharacterized protein (TIGR02996 family)